MEIIPEPDWAVLLSELLRNKGISVIIGETDSGKSTLAKYLIFQLVFKDLSACLVDADVGQSSLGLPGTVCMKTFATEADLNPFSFEKMSFVGTINPSINIPQIISASKKMADECIISSDLTVVDTSGLVTGALGENLKIAKIRALRPAHIIALQRENELEHILRLVSNSCVHRIKVSQYVRARPFAIRLRYRKKKIADYFQNSALNDFILHSCDATFFFRNKTINIKEETLRKGTILGLNHADNTIALGILEDISDNSIIFSSTLGTMRNINRVILSNIPYAGLET